MNGNQWARLLTYVTGLVNQELLLQNEYLAAENRILRAHLPARLSEVTESPYSGTASSKECRIDRQRAGSTGPGNL